MKCKRPYIPYIVESSADDYDGMAIGIVPYETMFVCSLLEMDRPTPQDLYDRFRISEHALNGELSEEHLQEVSHFIDHNTLGPELGLTSQDMKDINLDERAEDLRRAATLRKWKEVYAFNATYRKLIEALLKCRKADQAVKVCELLTCKCII